MKYISTRRNSEPATFFEAMRSGLAPDGGLYVPSDIPKLPDSFLASGQNLNFSDIAFKMAVPFLSDELSEDKIRSVVEDAFNFPVVLKKINDQHSVLELFHGPTLAFKDYGARFMARLFSEIARRDDEEITILVATSGDTGSAVAQGFYKVPGVKVCLLYPKGKVSPLQEKQMTTLGENITALEVDGVFDDCQHLVKRAFVDGDLNKNIQLSSANSINIARLVPQSFYYAYAITELKKQTQMDPVISVPSGNFGNLTGGLLAKNMGLPVNKFIAATNQNDVVPRFLGGEKFEAKNSVQTISNAMDVGNPSNFSRMLYLYSGSEDKLRKEVTGYSFSDDETRQMIKDVYEKYGYMMCPHTAVGFRAAIEYQSKFNSDRPIITLATAHPVKFRDVIEPVINTELKIPERLSKWVERDKKAIEISNLYEDFKDFLLAGK